MSNWKFRVRDKAHEKEIQEALFKAGFIWYGTRDTICREYKSAAIFAYPEGKTISHTILLDDFFKRNYKEMFVVDGKIVSDDPDIILEHQGQKITPVGLRPKSIVASLRIKEILEAMNRYVEVGEKVPLDWQNELWELFEEKDYVV